MTIRLPYFIQTKFQILFFIDKVEIIGITELFIQLLYSVVVNNILLKILFSEILTKFQNNHLSALGQIPFAIRSNVIIFKDRICLKSDQGRWKVRKIGGASIYSLSKNVGGAIR